MRGPGCDLFPAMNEEIKGVSHVCVTSSPLCVVLPADHPLAHLESIPLAALAQETWIATPRHLLPHITAAFLSLCQQAGFQPRFRQTLASPYRREPGSSPRWHFDYHPLG